MKGKLKAAVIGVGRKAGSAFQKGVGFQIGYYHGRILQANPAVELVAGADINQDNLDAFCQTFGTAGYLDYRQMLAEHKPDIVSICTYVGTHRQMIEDCARSGVKGILCEKPFLAAPADLRRVRDLAGETGVKIMVAHIRRYFPAMRRARQLLVEGAIGRPLLFCAGIEGWDLSEMGSHVIDLFRFFNGDAPVLYVMGQGRVRGQRVFGHATEDHAAAYFEFVNGVRGVVDGGRGLFAHPAPPDDDPFRMHLLGDAGSLNIYQEKDIEVYNARGLERISYAENGWNTVWPRLVEDLLAWLGGGPEPDLGLTNVLKSAELNLGAYLSMLRGDRIDLPLDDTLDEWPLEPIARRYA